MKKKIKFKNQKSPERLLSSFSRNPEIIEQVEEKVLAPFIFFIRD